MCILLKISSILKHVLGTDQKTKAENDSIFHLLSLVYWPEVQYMVYWSVSNSFMWNIESLAKYPIINYAGFSCNNMANFLVYQILANRFALKLNMWKNWRCHFSYWYPINGHEIRRNCLAPWSVSLFEYDLWIPIIAQCNFSFLSETLIIIHLLSY